MTKTIYEYNHINQEEIIREMTAEEIADLEEQSAINAAKQAADEAAELEEWTSKRNAYAKLGLSADEIEILVPTPPTPRPEGMGWYWDKKSVSWIQGEV